jgi:hypothetical protein
MSLSFTDEEIVRMLEANVQNPKITTKTQMILKKLGNLIVNTNAENDTQVGADRVRRSA